ncbi:MAG: hypothetical protein IT319_02490 [Anaerolineae bacterium]|nr:hypothetical protein [Anaerolineae bacterium]
MSKLGAMMRYELLMAWRRRSLPILWLLLLGGVVFFTLLVNSVNAQSPVMDESMQRTISDPNAPEWAHGLDVVVTTHTIGLINIVIAGMVFFMVGVTLLMAEVIPLDRQFKVRELLDTLPLSRAVYFGGKLLGVWAGLVLAVVIVGAICAVVIRVLIGEYDLRVFAVMWVATLLPMSFVASGVSVLVASFVGSRRGAVMVGLVVMPFVLVLVFTSVVSFAGVGALIEPVYAVGILMMPGAEANAEIVSRIANTLLLFAGVLLAVWTVVWLNARARDEMT